MKDLPANVKAYKRTDTFNEKTVPAGLLKDHLILEGVWAKIVVLKGTLTYVIQGMEPEQIVLSQYQSGVIEGNIYHHVIPHEDVQFYVEFYK